MSKHHYAGNSLTTASLENYDSTELLELYKSMLRIRLIEEAIEKRYHQNEMKTPIHLMIGQEATSVGACRALNNSDLLFSTHRTHGNYLAKGGNLNSMLAELYCRATGCAGSRGGSMHLLDKKVGMAGSSAICGGIIPIATGAALAMQMKKLPNVVMAFLGDGASEEGAVWESINFAALKKLPIIYFCENNFFSVCSPISDRQPERPIFLKSRAFGARGVVVDGMNVLDVYQAAKDAVLYAKSGKGPSFIEAPVYRFRAHGGAGDDSHTGYRSIDEVHSWEAHCPIKTLGELLNKMAILTSDMIEKFTHEISMEIENAFDYAISSPNPKAGDLYCHVYA